MNPIIHLSPGVLVTAEAAPIEQMTIAGSILGFVAVAISAAVLVLAVVRRRRAITGLMLAGAAAMLAVYATGVGLPPSRESEFAQSESRHDTVALDGPSDTRREPALEQDRSSSHTAPEWVGKPDTVGAIHTHTIKVGPYVNTPRAERQLLLEAERYTREYLLTQFGSDAVGTMRIEPRYLMDNVITARWVEPSIHEFAGEQEKLIVLHGKLEYTPETRNYFQKQWLEYRAARNLWGVGLAVSAILGLVGTLLGYLRLDTATRGYYSTPLKVGAAAVAATICGNALLAAHYLTGPLW